MGRKNRWVVFAIVAFALLVLIAKISEEQKGSGESSQGGPHVASQDSPARRPRPEPRNVTPTPDDRPIGVYRTPAQPALSPGSEPNPRDRSSFDESKWYVGGTLHKATVREWHGASYANRLATCADFVASVGENRRLLDMTELKRRAVELEKAISIATRDIEAIQDNKIAEIAASCIVLMGYNR